MSILGWSKSWRNTSTDIKLIQRKQGNWSLLINGSLNGPLYLQIIDGDILGAAEDNNVRPIDSTLLLTCKGIYE